MLNCSILNIKFIIIKKYITLNLKTEYDQIAHFFLEYLIIINKSFKIKKQLYKLNKERVLIQAYNAFICTRFLF